MLRIFSKKSTPVESPAPKVAFCIPRGVLAHVLFDGPDAPFSDMPRAEQYDLADAIESGFHDAGWYVSYGNQALFTRNMKYHRRLSRLFKRGGMFSTHIKALIDRAYEYHQSKDYLGRGVPLPWPIDAVGVKGDCPKHDEIEALGLDEEWTKVVRQTVKTARACIAEKKRGDAA